MFIFNSILATKIQQFIDLRSLYCNGYHEQTRTLSHFDDLLVEQAWCEPRITSQLIDDYQCSQHHLAPKTQHSRFCVIRQFCEYLASADPLSYIPEPLKTLSPGSTLEPYIYTLADIQALMDATRHLPPTDLLRSHTYRTLLGLLYTTGIRIGEAIALNMQNFDCDEGRLFIACGKFCKARWIPLAPSVCTAVANYVETRCQYAPDTPASPLFINLRKRRLVYSTVLRRIHQLQAHAGVTRVDGTYPRLHDFRHTFAVNRLLDWYQQGKNVSVLLPTLTTYMGHVDIASTQIYLHPTQALLTQVHQRFYQHYLDNVKPLGEPS